MIEIKPKTLMWIIIAIIILAIIIGVIVFTGQPIPQEIVGSSPSSSFSSGASGGRI